MTATRSNQNRSRNDAQRRYGQVKSYPNRGNYCCRNGFGSWNTRSRGPNNLITNGSFELGANDAAPGGFTMKGVGSSDLTGWSVTQNNIDWDNAFWQAADGTHKLDLNGNLGVGGVSQTINTMVGEIRCPSPSPAIRTDLKKSGFGCNMLVSLTAFAGGASATTSSMC